MRSPVVPVLFLAACAEVLPDDTPYVDGPRVLAVKSEPAEPVSLERVTFTALYADETGALPKAALEWSFCLDPKPLAELGPVSSRCLDPDASSELEAMGSGILVDGLIPRDACSPKKARAPSISRFSTSMLRERNVKKIARKAPAAA